MNEESKQLMFSLITGDIYVILADEIKNMDDYQVPLKSRPSPKCNKCFGRLYTSKDVIHNLYIMCPKCMIKCIDMDKIKSLVVPSNQTQEQV